MNTFPLVSVIIPTYNRAHLIEETLDSIVAQSYIHWECIVVDDGSNDQTKTILNRYIKMDSRFRYLQRPNNRAKGGNAARNYGFEESKGALIQWFDSDDLMEPEKLALKVEAIQKHQVDFVISKTKYFNRPNFKGYAYNFSQEEVNFEAFATGSVSWFTPDLLLKRVIADTIAFNETLKAGQEYNFNCKLLVKTNNAFKLDKFLTLRRAHEDSIGNKRKKDRLWYLQTKFDSHWVTYIDVHQQTKSKLFTHFSLLKCIYCYLESNQKIVLPLLFKKELRLFFKKRYPYFSLAVLSNRIFGKYHYFYSKLK